MLFMFLATDAENTGEARAAARPRPFGTLGSVAPRKPPALRWPQPAARNPSVMSGSLIVADFPDLDAAEAWAGDDPYVHAGVYAEMLIRPFKQVFPK